VLRVSQGSPLEIRRYEKISTGLKGAPLCGISEKMTSECTFVLTQKYQKVKAEEKMAKKTFIPLKSIQLVLLRRTSNSIDFLTLHFCFFYTHFFLGRSLMCHFPPSGLQSPVIEV
jgi:hypothetical protein